MRRRTATIVLLVTPLACLGDREAPTQACDSNSDCPAEHVCVSRDGERRCEEVDSCDCADGCLLDSDCAQGATCAMDGCGCGVCILIGKCFEEICDPQCLGDADCVGGETCVLDAEGCDCGNYCAPKDGDADCGGEYSAEIVYPLDGTTNVPRELIVQYSWSSPTVPDRYLAMLSDTGTFPQPVEWGEDGGIEWQRYLLAPDTTYELEIGWSCAGENWVVDVPLDSATFTTGL